AGRVGMVVVDSVSVKGERGEAEKRDRVGGERLRPFEVGGGRVIGAGRCSRLRGLTVHQLLLLLHDQSRRVGDRMVDGDEYELAASAVLLFHRGHSRPASGRRPYPEGAVKAQ